MSAPRKLERPTVDVALARPLTAPSKQVSQPDLARDIGWVIRGLWRRRWLLIALSALGAAAAVAFALWIPDRFTAAARLSVSPAPIAGESGEIAALPQAQTITLETEVQALWDGALLVETARRLGLADSEAFSPVLTRQFEEWVAESGGNPDDIGALQSEIVAAFADAMSVGVVGQSRIIEVSVETLSPTLSAEIANTLLELHVERRRAAAIASLDAAESAIEAHIATVEADLAEVEREFRTLEAELGGTAMIDSLQAALVEVNRRMVDVGARLSSAEAAVVAAEAGVPSAQSAEAAGFQQLLAEQAAARAKLGAVGEVEGTRSREFLLAQQATVAADAAVAAAQEALSRSRRETVAQIRAERDNLLEARDRLRAQLAETTTRMSALQPLRRNLDSRATGLEGLHAYAEQLSARRARWDSAISVASRAVAPIMRSGPNRKLVAGGVGVAAVALALLAALTVEALRGTISGSREVEDEFGAPTLGALPRPPSGRSNSDLPGLIAQKPGSPYVEALRALAFAAVPPGGCSKVILVVELGRPRRKRGPRLSLAIGHALAADGRRVAVVATRDAPSSASGTAGADEPPSAAVAGRVVELSPASRPATSEAGRALLQDARQHFDVVLVDGGDDPGGSAPRLYAPFAEAALFAVHRNRARRRAFSEALGEASRWPTRFLGAAIIE